jgi:hypothetical protein
MSASTNNDCFWAHSKTSRAVLSIHTPCRAIMGSMWMMLLLLIFFALVLIVPIGARQENSRQ